MKLLLHFLRPYWKLCLMVLLSVTVDVTGALLVPTITADMINLAVTGGSLDEIIWKGIAMLAVSIITGGSVLAGSWFCSKASAGLGRDMRNAIYDKTLTFSSEDFERFGTASMVTRTINDINTIQQAFVMFIQMVLPVPIMCALGIAFTFRISSAMGLLILGIMAFVMVIAISIIRKASSIFAALQKLLDRVNVILRENITGVRVIRAFNKENYESGRMEKTFSDYAASAIQANRLFAALDSLAMVSINLCIVAILYIGGNQVGAGKMAIGDITAVTEYAIWILFYLVMAQMVVILLPRAIICLDRIGEVLSLEPEIQDGAGGRARPDSPAGESEPAPEVVRFENAAFRFEDADEETLSGLSFSFRRGETTAIIGGTGSGKSTIAKLILRYHDVTSGRILFQGQNIRDLRQHDLREHIAYVPQKAWLFSGTIEDNLKYGKPDADRAEMERALSIAQAGFVDGLPGGLTSHVAQGGANFSGGQKQRLSIARAIIKKADLYIFDDSFSALDFKTDAALRRALADEIKDSSILIIAQRISTILHADQIIVLDDGRIAGMGKHSDLMENCPVYRDIAQSQMKGGGQNG